MEPTPKIKFSFSLLLDLNDPIKILEIKNIDG